MSDCNAENLVLRSATINDWRELLEWRNDPHTRFSSRNTDVVDEESHLRWLEASLNNPERSLLIAELTSKPVGSVRIDFGHPAEVSWTVAPLARGKGIGSRMVPQALINISIPLIAVVKRDNTASIKIALAAGFKSVLDDGEWITLQRIIY